MAAYSKVPAYLLLISFYVVCGSTISDLRLCADKYCEETISHATALMKYDKLDPAFLRFKGGDVITIKSKSAGKRPDLWGGVTKDGKRGYFPKAFVREFKVIVNNPEFTIPTEDLSIEKKLGLRKVEPPKQQDDVGDKGGGDDEPDDTELDDTELPEELPEDTQKDVSPPPDTAKADTQHQEEQKKEELDPPSKADVDDTEIDETEIGDDEDDEDPQQTKTDSQSEHLSHTESQQPVTDTKTDEDGDDTEFDKEDDDETVVPDLPDVKDNLPGSEESDKATQTDASGKVDTQTSEQEEDHKKQKEHLSSEQQQQHGEQQQQQDQASFPDSHKSSGDLNLEQGDRQHLLFKPHQHQDQEQQHQMEQQNIDHDKQINAQHVEKQQQVDPNQQQQQHQQVHPNQEQHQQVDPKQQQQHQQVDPNQQQQQQQLQQVDPDQQHQQQHDWQVDSNQQQQQKHQQVDPNQQQQQQHHEQVDPNQQQQQKHQQVDHNQQQQHHEQVDPNQQHQQVDPKQQQQQQHVAANKQEQHRGDPHQQHRQDQQDQQEHSRDKLPPVESPVLTTDLPPNLNLPPVYEEVPSSRDAKVDSQPDASQPLDDPPDESDIIDSKPALEKLQTGGDGMGTVEEIVKSDAPKINEQQMEKEEKQQNFDPTTSQENIFLEPPGDIMLTASQPGLSTSMGEQLTVTESVPTPGLDAQATQDQPPIDTGSVAETREQNLRETVIDGTTIPLYDDMDIDAGFTSVQDMGSSPSTVMETYIKPTETHYTPQETDLPFADEPPGFEYTQGEPSKEQSQEEKKEEEVEKVNEEEKHEEDKGEKEEEKSIVDLPVNDTHEQKDGDIHIEPTADQMYHSDDFLSRKPLSVGQGHPPANQGQGHKEADKQQPEASKASGVTEASSGFVTTTVQPDIGEIPAPPLDTTTKATNPADSSEVSSEAPPSEDPYKTGVHVGRHFSEDRLEEEPVGGEGVMSRIEGSIKSIIVQLPPSVQSFLEQEPLGLSPTLFVLVTIATVMSLLIVSVCSCLCGGGKKVNKKDPLVVVREIEEKLFIATKEKENLEDELQQMQNEKSQLEKRLRSNESSSGTIQTDLQNVQLHNEALKQQATALQEQVDELSGQLSSNKSNNQSKDKQVKDLQKQFSKLEEKHKKAEEQLETRTRELKDTTEDMKTLTGQIKSLNEQVKHLETSKQQLLSEADDWKEKLEDVNERQRQNEEEMKQLQETVAFKDNEMEVLKDCFRQLKVLEGDDESEGSFDQSQVEEKIQKMMDVSRVNASLCALEDEKNSLDNRLQIETDARKEVEDQLAKCQRDMDTLQTDKMKSDRQSQEAQTKLSVLSNYFKEKEAQLQRELGEHEALKKQNVNKLENIDEHAKMMEEEVEMYKTQIDGLKRELASSERDFRSQIAANEKKAHENWLAARAAERELKEVRHDAGVLRQRLTELERRQMMGPGGLIRPLPTRGMPPPGMMNGPPPGMERSPSRGSMPPPPPHLRDDEFRRSPHERLPPPPDRRPPPPGGRLPHHGPPDGRSPPPGDRMPPPGGRMPPPVPEGRSPPPFDRRPIHPMDRRTPPYRPPHPDMMSSPRGPAMFGAGSPPPRMPPPPGVDPRMGPRTSSPHVRPPPPGREGRPPRQHSQV